MPDFGHLYREVHPRLVAALTAACGDADLAADAAEEAAVRAIERWDRVQHMANPQGWLYRVALNEIRRRQRRAKLEQRLIRRAAASAGPVPGPTGEIWALVSGLSPRQREAVALRHVGGLTEPEIAGIMGITRGTVSSTLRAAYGNLRAATAERNSEVGDPPAPKAAAVGGASSTKGTGGGCDRVGS